MCLRTYRRKDYDRPIKPELPSHIYVDPATVCNLKCPICPTGNGSSRLKKMFMNADTFQRMLDKLPGLRNIELYNWGESLLNPDILEIIAAAKQRGIKLTIHSNFSFEKDDAFFRRLVELPLDTLFVSADGATQATYEKFRVGGRLELVLDNMRRVVKWKRELNSDKPRVTWKMIVNRYSEDEVEMGRTIASEIGVEFALAEMGLGEFLPDPSPGPGYDELVREWLPQRSQVARQHLRRVRSFPVYPGPCPKLHPEPGMVISASGGVFPCCYVKDEKWAFGNMNEQSLEEIWYGDRYKSARALFSNEALDCEEVETICHHCEAFRKVKHRHKQ
jgi:radical SAM protein with 4Fe4S-binding SPASM domain